MSLQQISFTSDRVDRNHVGARSIDRNKYSRNPFDSPSLSTSSINDSDSGSASGQDEFHLQRYSSNAKYNHVRQISRSTNNDDRQRPDLNIITTFTSPKMPMKSTAVKINEVQAKQIQADRAAKAVSVVSHKAVQSAISPPDYDVPTQFQSPSSGNRQLANKNSKRSKPIKRLQNAILQRQMSPLTQRVPIGITIPREQAAMVDQNTDSALQTATPITPAIVVTPAGEQKPWVLQRKGTSERDPASSIYSAMPLGRNAYDANIPPTPRTARLENVYMDHHGRRASQDSSEMIIPESSDSARPKSQGWWNLMLSPLVRAGSLASRKGQQLTDTPPVPPLPFPNEKGESPILSARSDPSFLVSPHETEPSPDTPRRQGLAGARASTWSRWTEWEDERAGGQSSEEDNIDRQVSETAADEAAPVASLKGTGLAAEYYHACAVEQLTGRPYFECINHDCAEQLPKLHSIHDLDKTKGAVLASPFEENRGMDLDDDTKSPDGLEAARSPSVLSELMSPDVLSPNVRQASMVPVFRARASDTNSDRRISKKEATDNKTEPEQDKAETPLIKQTSPVPSNNSDLPKLVTLTQPIAPPPQTVEIKVIHQAPPTFEYQLEKISEPFERKPFTTTDVPEPISEKTPMATETPISPEPMTPEGKQSLGPTGAIPLSEMEQRSGPGSVPNKLKKSPPYGTLPGRPAFITAETEYPPLPDRMPTAAVTAQDLDAAPRRLSIEERRQRLEKEDATARKLGGLWRGRGCFPSNGCMGRDGREGRTKRRWIFCIILLLIIIIVVSIVLAITLTRKGDGTPVESQWLNLTGFPAMPTGILTIAAPRLVAEEKRCVVPTTMWSCAVPKEDRDEIGSNDPNQPNFRFEIKFRNGTVPANMTIPLEDISKRASDVFNTDIFVPNPSPPNQADQIFMGNTTDNVTTPFDGEETPFFITFMPTFPILPEGFNESTKRLFRRQSNSSLLDPIPPPELADDGSAAPTTLLPTTPFPISQPIRLYNRGLQDEHYGFYMYYDKSVFLFGLQIDKNGVVEGSDNAAEADQDGGSTKESAKARCTFAQTRYLVKMFTNPSFAGVILPSTSGTNATSIEDATSSATNFNQPGSFPYPATIAIDRHGGDIDTKAVWCYSMKDGGYEKDLRILIGENRRIGGALINASPSLGGNDTDFDTRAGGIDGGTGGCGCTWQNWQ